MKRGCILPLAVAAMTAATVRAAEPDIRIELNGVDTVHGRCRLSFVVENRSDVPVESLKLDLALFGKDGVIQRRLAMEMGPVRRAKTIVKAFDVDSACDAIGSVLVNDVTTCMPAPLGDCLDRLALASRIAGLRLFK